MPPAARIGDMHTCPLVNPGPVPHVGGPITTGAPTVLIGGPPAARVTDMATCAGPPDTIVMGSPTVIICGQMAARIGDNTAHGGVIVAGCPTVLIGGSGAGGGAGVRSSAAVTAPSTPPEAVSLKGALDGAKIGMVPPGGAGLPAQTGRTAGVLGAAAFAANVAKWGYKLLISGPGYVKAAYWAAKTGQDAGLAAFKHGVRSSPVVGAVLSVAADTLDSAYRNRSLLASGDPSQRANYAGRVLYAAAKGVVSAGAGHLGGIGGAVVGAKLGACIGLLGGPPGAAIGAAIGAGVGYLLGSWAASKAAGAVIDRATGGEEAAGRSGEQIFGPRGPPGPSG